MKKKFYIIENLRSGYPKIGYELYLSFRDKADFAYHPCDSRQKLMGVLNLINIECFALGKRPFVHLDCHADENGIEIISTSGTNELIDWQDISVIFRKIYRTSKRRSMLCLSGCQNFNAAEIIPHFDTCPYDYIGGSFEENEFQLSLDGYKLFYEQVLTGEEPVEAGMKVHRTFSSLKFACLSSLQIFEIALKNYVKVKMNPEEIEKERKNTIENMRKIRPLTKDIMRYIEYKYSDDGIAEYLEEWRNMFFS